jgi:ribosomal protein S18 acetylase RimI-like enzyme
MSTSHDASPANDLLQVLGGTDAAIPTAEDVPQFRIPWNSRFSQRELTRLLERPTTVALWMPRTGEFLISGPWRNRTEITSIVDISATGSALELLRVWARYCAARGFEAIVASEQSEKRRQEFYVAAGMELLEEIVVYEMDRLRIPPAGRPVLNFAPVTMSNEEERAELERLDHAAFPWFWWNSPEEFRDYADAPGVTIDLGRDAVGRPMAYVGYTRFRTWGHLDRIAVQPETQGQGLGRVALDHVLRTMGTAGARRIALSTQANNTRSRRMYESAGFRRNAAHDYRVWGVRFPTSQHAATPRGAATNDR